MQYNIILEALWDHENEAMNYLVETKEKLKNNDKEIKNLTHDNIRLRLDIVEKDQTITNITSSSSNTNIRVKPNYGNAILSSPDDSPQTLSPTTSWTDMKYGSSTNCDTTKINEYDTTLHIVDMTTTNVSPTTDIVNDNIYPSISIESLNEPFTINYPVPLATNKYVRPKRPSLQPPPTPSIQIRDDSSAIEISKAPTSEDDTEKNLSTLNNS